MFVKKLFRFLIIFLFISLVGTTTYGMVEQKSSQVEQKIPQIKATSAYALYCEIHTLLAQEYTPESIVTALKEQKIEVNGYERQNTYIGYTALHIAVYLNPSQTCIKIPQILIDAGAAVNARINSPESKLHDCTPLHLALFAGFLGYVPMLLNAHAHVNARINNPGSDRHGWRPLDVAAYQFLTDEKMSMVIRSLVAHGARIRGMLRKASLGFTMQRKSITREKIINAIIHGKMDRLRERITCKKENMVALTALFDKLHVLDGIPAAVKQLAVAYDGGDHPYKK